MRNPSLESFFVNTEEVLPEIKNLKNNKSTEPSSISTKFLKLFQTLVSDTISWIANIYFSTGNFPSGFKIANLLSTFKKDNHALFNNYFSPV